MTGNGRDHAFASCLLNHEHVFEYIIIFTRTDATIRLDFSEEITLLVGTFRCHPASAPYYGLCLFFTSLINFVPLKKDTIVNCELIIYVFGLSMYTPNRNHMSGMHISYFL
mmetsp:Transcript_10842/g.16037  ORF Transcript_10842/g.16037 Transcript_10842/m.16037 type:complete len:111 (-) Transcript_10842:565-897(-)